MLIKRMNELKIDATKMALFLDKQSFLPQNIYVLFTFIY